jgi:tripartite-type tricarboxylate transporter receptor subunit TctC
VGEKIGQSIMVENRPGAGGTLGLDAVARAPADGYSLYLAAVTNQMIAGHLYHKADLQRDFVPVALIANAPHLLIVNNEVPAKTMAEFVTWLRSRRRHGELCLPGLRARCRTWNPSCCCSAPAPRPCMCPTRAAPWR